MPHAFSSAGLRAADVGAERRPPEKPGRLVEAYGRYFEVIRADTDSLRDEVFRLRYQVYCVENAFEPRESNPDQREIDALDSGSLHCLLIHRSSALPVGTARLILPRRQGQHTELPIWSVCAPVEMAAAAAHLPLERTAEISRFAVAKELRRRAADAESVAGGLTDGTDPRRIIPHVSLGLMRGIVDLASSAGITHLFAVMEPALLRMLQRLEIHFNNIGPVVDYHGRRQPCYCDLDHLLAHNAQIRPDVWEVLTDTGRLWPLNVGIRA